MSTKHTDSIEIPAAPAPSYMTQYAAEEILEEHFLGWYGDRAEYPRAAILAQGVLAWCWDLREETLACLEGDESETTMDDLVREVLYSIGQEDHEAARHMDPENVRQWIEDLAGDICEAIRETLDEEAAG